MRSLAASRLADAIETAVRAAPPLPDDPEEIPEGTDLQTLDWWLQLAARKGRAAERTENWPAMAQMGRLSAALFEAKRKATPPEVPDPNEHPDMVAAAKRAREQLHKLVESSVEK
jgi:hypothetical protein